MTSSNTHGPDGAGSSDDLRGLEILLVEDSWVVGKAMKDLLELLGAVVVGPAATTAEAERLLSEHAPDVALVDFHLRGGELSYSLIARLHEQGVPVILVSGSSESLSGLPVEAATILEFLAHRPTIQRRLCGCSSSTKIHLAVCCLFPFCCRVFRTLLPSLRYL